MILSMLSLSAVLAVQSPQMLFEEEFDRYPENPVEFHENSHIWEAPASLKTMSFTPKARETLRKTPYLVPEKPSDFKLRFLFTLKQTDKNSFSVPLYFEDAADPAKKCTGSLNFTDNGAALSGLPKGDKPISLDSSHDGITSFMNGTVHEAAVIVHDGYAELYVEYDGVMRLFSRGRIAEKGAVLTGFNFVSSCPITLDGIQVWQIDKDDKPHEICQTNTLKKDTAFEVEGMKYPAAFSIRLSGDDGKEKDKVFTFRSFSQPYSLPVKMDKEWKMIPLYLPDAGFSISGKLLPKSISAVRTRPDLSPRKRYENEGIRRIAAKWNEFPAATETPFLVRVKQQPDNMYELWLNEKIITQFRSETVLNRITFTLPEGTVREYEPVSLPAGVSADFLPLNPVAAGNSASFWKSGDIRRAKLQMIENIPFLEDPQYRYPLSVCEENLGNYQLECDGYLSRTPFDAMPSSVQFSVPVSQYYKAYALCSVDPNADNTMVPVITARLTNFTGTGSRPTAICNSTVTLPAKPGSTPLPDNVRIVGGTKDNPIYLVEFNMDVGNLEDVIYRENNQYLDFEFLGKLYDKDNFYLTREQKPSLNRSSVILHAATLKRSPAEFRVEQGRPAATWYLAENPFFQIYVNPLLKGEYTVKTNIKDIHGKTIQTLTEKFDREETRRISFPVTEYGWYGLESILSDSNGNKIISRNSAIVLLPPDTRKAGYESPYFCWNYNGAGYTITDVNIWGDILHRMGVRKTLTPSNHDENTLRQWKLSYMQIPHLLGTLKPGPEGEAKAKEILESYVKRFPHCKYALVFHESGGGPYPLEIFGEKTEIAPEQKVRDQEKAERALFQAEMIRKYAPGVKIVIGNNGGATEGLLAQLFREKFPREKMDFLGNEAGGGSYAPEYELSHGNWALKKLGEIYGYKDLNPDACYEWHSRRIRFFDNAARHAAVCMRDMLLSHAWHQNAAPSVCIQDTGVAYDCTTWGQGAYSRRGMMEPYPVAAALAAITQVLDCAELTRQIPTGSNTAYTLEFQRKAEKEFIYAVWTARGTVNADAVFAESADILSTEMCGAQRNLKTASDGKLRLAMTEEPLYLTSKVPLKDIRVEQKRVYPNEPIPGSADVAVTLDNPDAVSVIPGLDSRIRNGKDNVLSCCREGKFQIHRVQDEEKGSSLEIELVKEGNIADCIKEVGFIKLKNPVPLAGNPHTIGVECKGNSTWGMLCFELTDAQGEVWLTAGTGGYGCETYNWDGRMSLNYDGWHTLLFPVVKSSPVKIHSPGENEWQWQRSGDGDGQITYPVKLTGIGVIMYRKVMNLTEFVPASTKIRLHNFVSFR